MLILIVLLPLLTPTAIAEPLILFPTSTKPDPLAANITVLKVAEGPTSWNDEKAMRARMAWYAEQKLAQKLHFWNVTHRERAKRDGGTLSVPIATALITGVIGMTTKTMSDIATMQYTPSQGGCSWFGTAPLCNPVCPSEYDFIRAHNGRCGNGWFSSFCVPDPGFGKPCTTVFGDYFEKKFCCKSDPTECTWSGRWMGANTAHNIYCRYDHSIGRCGALDCSINAFDYKVQNATDITGDRCDRLELFGLAGKATCGYIAWFDEQNSIINSWYKTN